MSRVPNDPPIIIIGSNPIDYRKRFPEIYAPAGMWRVRCVQLATKTLERREWMEGDYPSRAEAVDVAKSIGGETTYAHVCNEHAAVSFSAGGRLHDVGRGYGRKTVIR